MVGVVLDSRYSAGDPYLLFLSFSDTGHWTRPAYLFQPPDSRRRKTDQLPILPSVRGTRRACGIAGSREVFLLPQICDSHASADLEGRAVSESKGSRALGPGILCAGFRKIQASAAHDGANRLLEVSW